MCKIQGSRRIGDEEKEEPATPESRSFMTQLRFLVRNEQVPVNVLGQMNKNFGQKLTTALIGNAIVFFCCCCCPPEKKGETFGLI